ncbi:MAG: lipoyl(octanoyl) transferase LipB [Bacteroidetes bacterium]|nr:MAG: lipoyl(octanoyl) transferase LipB [Bacteroidota bacterium]
MQIVQFQDLGHWDYQKAWDYQSALHRALVDNKLQHRDHPPGSYSQQHYLLLVEHPHVYTLGKSGSLDHLLLSEEELTTRGIQYFPINRGGDITYHGPGQIVGYPILDLECFFTDVHRYVRNIEEVIIRTLAEYDIEAVRVPDYTGVWCLPDPQTDKTSPGEIFRQKFRKICAIGVHLSRWVTLHGFAFNVNTDLNYFKYIVPCGINDADKTVTSLEQELGRPVDISTVQSQIRKHFCAVFECELAPS